MKFIRIILIDDNRILRDGIAAVLNEQKDMSAVALSNGSDNFLKQVGRIKPTMVLVDLSLNGRSGVRSVELIKKRLPSVRIIGMGLGMSHHDIVEFIEAGASGFILKEASVKDFLSTIRLVAKGVNVLPPLLTGSLFSRVVELALERGVRRITGAERMTRREREVIALIADGLSNKEIASTLNIATYTVKSHVHNILEKLTLRSRLQIAQLTSKRSSSS